MHEHGVTRVREDQILAVSAPAHYLDAQVALGRFEAAQPTVLDIMKFDRPLLSAEAVHSAGGRCGESYN